MNVQRTCAVAALIAGVLASGCESRGGNTRWMTRDAGSAQPVTLAVVNARVWTGDSARPWAEAFAVRGERIATVGSSAAVRKIAGNARVIDAAGRMVVPGFIDSHVHFIDGGFGLSSVQLRDAKSPAEFIAHQGVRGVPRRPGRGSPAATGTTSSGAGSCRGTTGSTPSRRTIPSGSIGSTGTCRSRTRRRCARPRSPARRAMWPAERSSATRAVSRPVS